jgi:hypothetical protein
MVGSQPCPQNVRQVLESDKHSSLLRTGINCVRKKFYSADSSSFLSIHERLKEREKVQTCLYILSKGRMSQA